MQVAENTRYVNRELQINQLIAPGSHPNVVALKARTAAHACVLVRAVRELRGRLRYSTTGSIGDGASGMCTVLALALAGILLRLGERQ